MNTLLWVLVGVLAYSVLAMWLNARGYLPESVRVQGPITTIHTKRGRALLNWLATPKRFWRAWSNVGLGVALVIMLGMFLLLLLQGLSILANPPEPTTINQPRSFLVIPGVNPLLPVSVAPEIVFGLLVGLVVHEGGHGLLCRVEDIDIESMGLALLTIVPVGAFVEPDEESQRRADRGSRSRMFAAGVTNNFAVTIAVFALLFGPVIGSIGLAPGVPVGGTYPGSPADQAGLDKGDRITAINGTPVSTDKELQAALDRAGETIAVTIATDDRKRTVTVTRSLFVVASVRGGPANLSVDPRGKLLKIHAVNGTPVNTREQFYRALQDRQLVTVSTSAGDRTFAAGAYVTRLVEGGPMANTSAPMDTPFVITAVAGERVVDFDDLGTVLANHSAGDTVSVRAYVNGSFETYSVTLGTDPSGGGAFLGVYGARGTSGLLLADFGIQTYPAETYLAILGGERGGDALAPMPEGIRGFTNTLLGTLALVLLLPAASFQLGIPNFPGFTGGVTNFYVIQGPLSFLGEWVFLLANLLFWTGWINFQLGLFNCIPGHPLDGGRILRAGAEAVVSRLPVANEHAVVRTITTTVGLTMLLALLLTVFGPQLLN